MSVKTWAVGQFKKPSGPWGSVAGWVMAKRPSNRERNAWTVDLLQIQPEERVLEIGFGPGLAVRAAASLAVRGFVAGVDHSEVMLRQASRLNSAAVEAIATARRLAREEGIFGGYSSGANVAAALHLLEGPLRGKSVATMICDSGLKYLSCDPWPSQWAKDLPSPAGDSSPAADERREGSE